MNRRYKVFTVFEHHTTCDIDVYIIFSLQPLTYREFLWLYCSNVNTAVLSVDI